MCFCYGPPSLHRLPSLHSNPFTKLLLSVLAESSYNASLLQAAMPAACLMLFQRERFAAQLQVQLTFVLCNGWCGQGILPQALLYRLWLLCIGFVSCSHKADIQRRTRCGRRTRSMSLLVG